MLSKPMTVTWKLTMVGFPSFFGGRILSYLEGSSGKMSWNSNPVLRNQNSEDQNIITCRDVFNSQGVQKGQRMQKRSKNDSELLGKYLTSVHRMIKKQRPEKLLKIHKRKLT